MAKVIDETWGIKSGLMTTIHSYTNDQVVLDFAHKDLRRARAAAINMIPSSTGAAKAIGLVLPKLKGKLTGISMRVPTPDVSIVDLAVVTEKPVASKEEVNAAFKKAAESGKLKGYLTYTETELVSMDFKGNPSSCTFDSTLTDVNGPMLKAFGWYDNEWGYSNRVIDLAAYIAKKMGVPAKV